MARWCPVVDGRSRRCAPAPTARRAAASNMRELSAVELPVTRVHAHAARRSGSARAVPRPARAHLEHCRAAEDVKSGRWHTTLAPESRSDCRRAAVGGRRSHRRRRIDARQIDEKPTARGPRAARERGRRRARAASSRVRRRRRRGLVTTPTDARLPHTRPAERIVLAQHPSGCWTSGVACRIAVAIMLAVARFRLGRVRTQMTLPSSSRTRSSCARCAALGVEASSNRIQRAAAGPGRSFHRGSSRRRPAHTCPCPANGGVWCAASPRTRTLRPGRPSAPGSGTVCRSRSALPGSRPRREQPPAVSSVPGPRRLAGRTLNSSAAGQDRRTKASSVAPDRRSGC